MKLIKLTKLLILISLTLVPFISPQDMTIKFTDVWLTLSYNNNVLTAHYKYLFDVIKVSKNKDKITLQLKEAPSDITIDLASKEMTDLLKNFEPSGEVNKYIPNNGMTFKLPTPAVKRQFNIGKNSYFKSENGILRIFGRSEKYGLSERSS
jgi:hypothetical protein